MSSETRPSSTLGARLHDERLRRGWTLAEVEAKTRISERFLQLIEEDRADQIPGVFFAKSFLRQYSTLLGMHDESVERIIQDRWGGVSEALPGENEPPGVAPLLSSSLTSTRSSRQKVWIPILLVIAAIAAGAFVYSRWQTWSQQQSRQELAAPAESTSTGASSPSSTAEVTPADPAPSATQAEPDSPQAQSSPPQSQPPVAANAPRQPITVVLRARQRVWVEGSSDGRRAFSTVMQPGEVRTLQGSTFARLVVGNAAGLEVKWNGRQLGSLGSSAKCEPSVLLPPLTHSLEWTPPPGPLHGHLAATLKARKVHQPLFCEPPSPAGAPAPEAPSCAAA